MSELLSFSSLVGDIYDAALDAALWPSVLQKLCQFVPAAYGNIFIQDTINKSANSIFTWGVDAAFFRGYLEIYARINPLFPATFFQPVGQVFSVFDVMPEAQFERTRFFREWVRPQGLIDNLSVLLEKSATSCAMLALPMTAREGPLTDESRARMALIVPHVQRAVLISKAFDLQSAIVSDFTTTLEGIAAAIYLVDGQGRILHANRSGVALLEAGNVLHGAHGRIRAHDHDADQALSTLFAACETGDDLAVDARGTAMPVPSREGAYYAAHVLPLTSGARRQRATAHRAAAALFVHKAASRLLAPAELVARAYALTPRELAVLFAVIEMGGVAEVSEMLGLSEATVKTHLRHIFAKTGVTRQADLVKLIAGFISAAG